VFASATIEALSSILDAIGNTPLVRLTRCAPPNGAELWLKLEYANPTGSLRDRVALAMVEGAEREGAITHHRDHLAREIWEQTDGRVTAFCHGLGTAGSLIGVSEALKPRGVFIQAHEPAGSAAITRGTSGSFAMQGWTGMVMPHWDPDRVDHVEPIEDDAALEMTLRLSQEAGVFAGISTGANVVGAHRLAERLGPEAVIVTLAADSGFKYMSTPPYAALDAG
jgi:cysteine synthase A